MQAACPEPLTTYGQADAFAMLNDEQRAAVLHGAPGAAPAGPLMLVAGAGSGKTATLAARVARLLLDGADPSRLLLLSFSRRAAADLQRRVGHVLHAALGLAVAQPAPTLPWSGTFHSVAARLLREQATRIGLDPAFTILDRSDGEDLLGLLRHDLNLASGARRFPLKGTCAAICSRVLNSRDPLQQVLHEHFPWCGEWSEELRQLFRAYTVEKQQQHVLDYDDLLLYWWHMLDDKALARELGARFTHVLVDEYQDTNRLQAAMLLALKPDGRGLCVVGDDAQAIYSFRAAELRNMLDFAQQFEPPARVLMLQQNYRSTPAILQACNALIAGASQRIAKTLWSAQPQGLRPLLVTTTDESTQAAWVADQVLAQRESGVPLRQQAVLFRTGQHSAAVELELLRRRIPFVKYGGLKFIEAAHVKDLLSLLRWQQNPRCRSAGLRVLQLVSGLGPGSARRLLDALRSADDARLALQDFSPPARAGAAWRDFTACLAAMADAGTSWPGALDVALRWYLPQLQRLHDNAAARAADLEQLCRLAAGHVSRERFLAELTLDPPEASSDEAGVPQRDEDYLILSTIHSAKGQEWNAVYVLNVVDGCMPADVATGSAEQIDEERRLLYVAMTRARHHLALLTPQRFYVTQQAARGARHLYALPSRFISAEVARHFESTTPATAPDEAQPAAPGVPLDVSARMRSAWD